MREHPEHKCEKKESVVRRKVIICCKIPQWGILTDQVLAIISFSLLYFLSFCSYFIYVPSQTKTLLSPVKNLTSYTRYKDFTVALIGSLEYCT